MRRRGRWTPPPTQRPGSIDDAQARALARAYAHDECVCGHYRVEHKGVEGCQRCRRCTNYAWVKAGGVEVDA